MPWMDLNDSDAHEEKMTWKDIVLVKKLWPYIKPYWVLLAFSTALLPLISLTQIAQPFIIKSAIDGAIRQHDLPALGQSVLLFLGLLASHYTLRYVQMILAQVAGQRIILALRTALFDHLQSLSMDFYHKTPIGKLVTRVSSDVENVSEMFASGGIAIFADFAVIIGILIAMAVMNWHLALLAYLMIPVVALTMEFFRRRSRSAYNDIRVHSAQLNSALQENLTGIEVIQLLQREKLNRAGFDQKSKQLMQSNLRSVIYDSAFTASVEVLSISTLLLVLGYAAWTLSSQGSLPVTFGVIVAFIQYIQMLFEPIEELSDKFTVIQSGLASVEKIMDLMHVHPKITTSKQPQALIYPKGGIRFENVTFGYHPHQPVLSNLSLTIRPGEKVAFIGATGAGKSTLIKLLNRQYDPQQGRILFDGKDIKDLALNALREQIVVIPQDDFLFSRTIQENITLAYQQETSTEALMDVARRVNAHTVIEQLPQGLQSVLPERGRNLSNGQRQLLVFARALWHNPSVLVLDEATSAIDSQTEALLQDALDVSLQGRTAILIAHRLSTIEKVDTIYVLAHGQIVESGSPEELLVRKGHYYQYLQQAGAMDSQNVTISSVSEQGYV